MKKFFFALFLILTLFLFTGQKADAAWTLALQMQQQEVVLGYHTYTFKITCISDGAALGDTQVSSISGYANLSDEQRQALKSGRLVSLTTDPDATGVPNAVYDVTIKNGLGAAILSATGRSTTVTEIVYTSSLMGFTPNTQGFPYIAVTDIGDATDQIVLYVEIWR